MSTPENPAPPARPRLLVIDDLESVRSALAEVLTQAGYSVATAATPDEALRFSRDGRWDGMVVDIDLAGSSGVELYGRILRLRGERRLPVVFFSARSHYALRLSLVGTAWAQVVEKPCGAERFLAVLADCRRAAAEADPAAPSV